MFKIRHKLLDLNFDEFFQENEFKKTRGNAFKLKLPSSKTKRRLNCFTCSIVKHWNQLKSEELNAKTVSLFKKNVDRYLRNKKIT